MEFNDSREWGIEWTDAGEGKVAKLAAAADAAVLDATEDDNDFLAFVAAEELGNDSTTAEGSILAGAAEGKTSPDNKWCAGKGELTWCAIRLANWLDVNEARESVDFGIRGRDNAWWEGEGSGDG